MVPPPPGRWVGGLRFTLMKPTQNRANLMMIPRGLQTARSVFQAPGQGLMEVSEMVLSGLCTVQKERRDWRLM